MYDASPDREPAMSFSPPLIGDISQDGQAMGEDAGQDVQLALT